MVTKLSITDDSGFIAIVNPDKYLSFVDINWTLSQLFNHFVDEMNRETFIIWATGLENTWTVTFMDKPSDKVAFREFNKSILVTNGQLFLTNYEDLTMAAEYEEEKIPTIHNSGLIIKLDNGYYNFLVRQMFDPENYNYTNTEISDFEIIIQSDNFNKPNKIETVFWWTDKSSS